MALYPYSQSKPKVKIYGDWRRRPVCILTVYPREGRGASCIQLQCSCTQPTGYINSYLFAIVRITMINARVTPYGIKKTARGIKFNNIDLSKTSGSDVI